MTLNAAGAQPRPGWTMPPDCDSIEAHLPRRRWRILHAAKPGMEPLAPMPNWVRTPEDFVRWLASRLSLNDLFAYFRNLEAIAKLSCDLELLRFARRYLKTDVTRDLIEEHERL